LNVKVHSARDEFECRVPEPVLEISIRYRNKCALRYTTFYSSIFALLFLAVTLPSAYGQFTPSGTSPIALGTGAVSTITGDFNGDHILDLAITNSGSSNITILLGDGHGGFTATAGGPITVGAGPVDIVVGKFNADQILDLAVITSSGVAVLLGDGTGNFTVTANPLPAGFAYTALAVGDFNSDGNLDVVSCKYAAVTLLLGNGQGSLTASATTIPAPCQSIALSDLNGDGKLDFVTADGNVVSIELGNGAGFFNSAAGSPFPTARHMPTHAINIGRIMGAVLMIGGVFLLSKN
jgi:hypothetical protein